MKNPRMSELDSHRADAPIPTPPAPDQPWEAASETAKQPPSLQPWPAFLANATDAQIRSRFGGELTQTIARHALSGYCVLMLFEPEDSLDTFDLDTIFKALRTLNDARKLNVLLVLLNRGGSVEPAYQIAKLCKAYSHERFIVAVPRHAKSASTLIALGADEVHIGALGQLGPIDPQLGGLPALGVAQALKRIALLSEQYPGSADMFSRYLQRALTVEQIGYCDRVSASAAQYAERLLSTKSQLIPVASQIANKLVYEYKDHGFVIDLAEAQKLLGSEWVKSDTRELALAEDLYTQFDWVNLLLSMRGSKRILVIGEPSEAGVLIVRSQKET